MTLSTTFQHVSYLWDDAKAARLSGSEFDVLPQPDREPHEREPHEREVALLLYRSNLLGADLRLTN